MRAVWDIARVAPASTGGIVAGNLRRNSLKPVLPLKDRRPDLREKQLAKARDDYAFAYDWPPGVATCADLPRKDDYSVEFAAKSLHAFVAIGANYAGMALEKDERKALAQVIESKVTTMERKNLKRQIFRLPTELASKIGPRFPADWQELEEIFATWKAPPVVDFFHRAPADLDLAFAWQRVAGFNPMQIERCAVVPVNVPLTQALFQRAVGDTDTLAAALAEGRLYKADYGLLDGVPAGVTDGIQKFLCAPIALFVVDKASKQLRPVAIQLGQVPGRSAPLFLPDDGWAWRHAMALVQVADANVHEGVVHLGRCHMVMEAVTVSLHRELSSRHPLFVLLDAHVEITLAINHSAKTSLIAPGGVVDRCFGPTIDAFASVVNQALKTYPLDQTDPRKDLAARGVDDVDALPVYPYRDDALPLWDALLTYLGEYVDLYYATDADVMADAELQGFVRTLGSADGGRLAGVPQVHSKEDLTYLLTRIVFIAGPQHSAVNFTQFPYMGFQANTAGASYRPPFTASTPNTEAEYTKMLPPWRIVIESSTMVYLLSNVHLNKLGRYGLLHFKDKRARAVVGRFQAALEVVEAANQERDATRLIPYPFLKPSEVLQSISI